VDGGFRGEGGAGRGDGGRLVLLDLLGGTGGVTAEGPLARLARVRGKGEGREGGGLRVEGAVKRAVGVQGGDGGSAVIGLGSLKAATSFGSSGSERWRGRETPRGRRRGTVTLRERTVTLTVKITEWWGQGTPGELYSRGP